MNRFFLALVCAAMVWLGASSAHAETAFWRCTATLTVEYKDGKVNRNGASREFAATSENDAIAIATRFWTANPDYPINPVKSRSVSNVRCEKRAMSPRKAEVEKRPVLPPPIPPAKAPKANIRLWTCRVKLRWHVGARYGDVDETWSDIEAPSEAAAMGIAIFRSQSRLKALSLSGTNPTWSKTDVKCA